MAARATAGFLTTILRLLLLLLLLLLLARPSCGRASPRPKACFSKPAVAVGNSGVWPDEAKDKGDPLYATCPGGLTGPYVVCTTQETYSDRDGWISGQWSDLKGPTECPGDLNPCPGNSDKVNTEALLGGTCRCKGGFKRVGLGLGTSLICTACEGNTYSLPGLATYCTPCPSLSVSLPDKSACRCPAGTSVRPETSLAAGNLICDKCPSGYYSDTAGSPRCSPCRGYYEYSAVGASQCETCLTDSYATAQYDSCQCNTGCSNIGGSAAVACVCPVTSTEGKTCNSTNSRWEGKGDICRCKAGYLQQRDYTSTTEPSCIPNTAEALCNGPDQYTIAGDKLCRVCPANSVPTAAKDGCICNIGYAPKSSTSSINGTLECAACPGGTYSRAGDLACTNCTERSVSGNAASGCIKCIYGIDREMFVYADNASTQGRRLQSTGLGNLSFPAAPESLDMQTLITTSSLQWPEEGSAAAASQADDAVQQQQQQLTLAPIHISPTLNINGKPATVLPMEVLRATWEGRDATDVAACLSGALLTTSNISLLAPPSFLAGLGLQQDAASSLLGHLLPQLLAEQGTAAVFTSSMYKGGPRLTARELKAALVKHYASLLPLPSCLRVPEAAAHKMRIALSNIVGMTTGTAARRGGELADLHVEMSSVTELVIEVARVDNEKHPELCAGIEGSSFRLRFAGFGGHSSLSAATANHIWVYAAVAEDVGLCGEAQ
ncbi:hypothetical protein OEZ85_009820 [Tetradesmus obliquus]|uniref:Tyrosine-protein kinase ephrin type A/B receptor-like domain-containing protein n=1 Tax=Tetradesmus obliquus TaxID=3088 RepID=A0ABY8UAE5_TETOB|nr:hypothetical protein OEZ85_009820 [Tetradesmus obliquus]